LSCLQRNSKFFLTLSRDGFRVAYVGLSSGTLQVYVRPLDQLEAKPISGTDSANSVFFSPDGQWIGYAAGGKMKKVPVTGGASLTLCDWSNPPWGADWGPDDTIVFQAGLGAGLLRVSAAGGKPQVLTTPDATKGETMHHWPRFLPGGKALLFSILAGTSYDDARIAVLDLKTGEKRPLLEGGANARYLPTGHLVYARAAALFAAPFDLDRLRVLGSPVPVLEGVAWSSLSGIADFAFPTPARWCMSPAAWRRPIARSSGWTARALSSPSPRPRVPMAFRNCRLTASAWQSKSLAASCRMSGCTNWPVAP
jgi:serine/threonine-protein kinase